MWSSVKIFTKRCPATSSEVTELATDVLEIPESLLVTEDALHGREKTSIRNCTKNWGRFRRHNSYSPRFSHIAFVEELTVTLAGWVAASSLVEFCLDLIS